MSTETCWGTDVDSFYGGKSRMACINDATVHVRGGCVHEHVDAGWLCEAHWAQGPTAAFCLVCFDADGHDCAVHFEVVSSAGAGEAKP